MADKKISQLTSASTPLTGSEELAIVQSGSTVKATAQDVADLAPQELPTQVVGDAGKFLQADGVGGVSYQSAGAPYKVYSVLFDGSGVKTFEYLQDGTLSFTVNSQSIYIAGLSLSSNFLCIVNVGTGNGSVALVFNAASYVGGGPFVGNYQLSFKKISNGGTVSTINSIFGEAGLTNVSIELHLYP